MKQSGVAAFYLLVRERRAYVIAAAAAFFIIAFSDAARSLVGALVLFLFGSFSTYYKRKLEDLGAVGFELVTFSAVVAGVAFGPVAGAVFGLASSLASVTISRDVGPTTLMFLGATTIIGAIAQPLSSFLGIVPLGMLCLAISTVMVQSFTFIFEDENMLKAAAGIGIVVNFIVNYFFFDYAAGPVISLIG